MNVVGLVIDLKYLNESTRKEFFLLDKIVRRYSCGNDSELFKILSDDRYWYFNFKPVDDIDHNLLNAYKEFCRAHDCVIKIYTYDISSTKLDYGIDRYPVLGLDDNVTIYIRCTSIHPDAIVNSPVHSLDFVTEVLENESDDTISLILNDYERILSIVRLFIVFDYNKIKINGGK